MGILIDEDMPYAHELFSRLGDVQAVPGHPVPTKTLTNTNASMVHSVTRVNGALLSGKTVKFIGTTTAGTGYVDQAWLQQARVGFSAAPNCNAIAVVEYVFSSLLMLTGCDGFALRDRTVGIVGVDNVGERSQKRLEALGIKTLLYDSSRADRGDGDDFRSLDALVQEADVLTFHTSLYEEGPYKTQHLTDKSLIGRLKPGAILINTCRGPVVDDAALLKRLEAGQPLGVALDVWEPESDFNIGPLKQVNIGTAHIADYTLKGRTHGTTQVFETYSAFIGHPQQMTLNTLLSVPEFGRITLHGSLDQSTLRRLVHLVYDVRRGDASPRKVIGVADKFDELRRNYQERREWLSLCVQCSDAQTAALLRQPGSNAVHHPAR